MIKKDPVMRGVASVSRFATTVIDKSRALSKTVSDNDFYGSPRSKKVDFKANTESSPDPDSVAS